MRSSVLLCYWHISQRPMSMAGTSGASLSPPFRNSMGGLPTGSGPHMAHLPPDAVGAGPVSAAIQTNYLVGEDPSDLLAISSPLNCSAHLANSSWNGGCLFKGFPNWVPSSNWPLALLSFLPSGVKQEPISIHGRLFKITHGYCFSCSMAVSLFWGLFFFSKNGREV